MSLKNFACLALFVILIQQGSALVCYECTNVTGSVQKDCGKPLNQTCDGGYNSCSLATMRFKSVFNPNPPIQMSRNCSINCNQEDFCKQMNATAKGDLLECNVHCCTGNNCNLAFPVHPTSVDPSKAPGTSDAPVVTGTQPKPEVTSSAPTFQLFSGVALFISALVALM